MSQIPLSHTAETPASPSIHEQADRQMPQHDARALTAGGTLATIRLDGQDYILRITRAGKLILTK